MREGYLTTHVLNTARGVPADGLTIRLYDLNGDTPVPLAEMVTNSDGRTNGPILPKGQMNIGHYELVFEAGAYLRKKGMAGNEPLFLDTVPIRFGIEDANAHYHVPLLLSPFGYSTYRGS